MLSHGARGYMSMIQLSINRRSEEVFEFTFFRNSPADSISQERACIVRLLDEAIDALMLLPQQIQNIESNKGYKITIQTGGLDA